MNGYLSLWCAVNKYHIGLLYSSTAVGNLLSAPIGGFLYDASPSGAHKYTASIAVAGTFLLSGMIFAEFINVKKNDLHSLPDDKELSEGSVIVDSAPSNSEMKTENIDIEIEAMEIGSLDRKDELIR